MVLLSSIRHFNPEYESQPLNSDLSGISIIRLNFLSSPARDFTCQLVNLSWFWSPRSAAVIRLAAVEVGIGYIPWQLLPERYRLLLIYLLYMPDLSNIKTAVKTSQSAQLTQSPLIISSFVMEISAVVYVTCNVFKFLLLLFF